MLWLGLRRLLFCFPAETAHELGTWVLRLYSVAWLLCANCFRVFFAAPSPKRQRGASEPGWRRCFGRACRSPLGLAAGFDKNGCFVPAMHAAGFGFVEVGTVTPMAQAGNPRPRMFRVPEAQGLINRLGFNNHGVAAMEWQLRQLQAWRSQLCPVGINLGKNKTTPNERAHEDYVAGLRALYRFADFFVINLSSPNTPGLRDLLAEAALEPLLGAVRREAAALGKIRALAPPPLLLKISPDMNSEAQRVAVDLAMAHGFSGIVATNTTISRDFPETGNVDPSLLREAGGLSGQPLRERSRTVLQSLRSQVGPKALIISVGGIDSVAEVEARLDLGADLTEVYTGFIYRGLALPRDVAAKFSR